VEQNETLEKVREDFDDLKNTKNLMEEDYKKKMQERENRLFELQMKLKNIEQEGIIEQEKQKAYCRGTNH